MYTHVFSAFEDNKVDYHLSPDNSANLCQFLHLLQWKYEYFGFIFAGHRLQVHGSGTNRIYQIAEPLPDSRSTLSVRVDYKHSSST